MRKYRWGILGLGSIANRFMSGLSLVERAELYAVASRDEGRARAFAEKHGAARIYTDYEKMVSDPAVDIVYIATPHTFHLPHAALALAAGKHVLVEKPACANRAQLEELFALAGKQERFLMEAMWTRFFPTALRVQQWIAEGRIGQVKQVQAAFSSRSRTVDPKSRVYDPALAGGALLDLGVYPITFADMCYQTAPSRIEAVASIGETGVDELGNYALLYPCGGVAMLTSGVNVRQLDTATVYGTEGSIQVPGFWHPTRAVLTAGEKQVVFEEPVVNEGFQYEILHLHECLDRGLTQSPVMSFEVSRRIMDICDTVRSRIGLRYPFE